MKTVIFFILKSIGILFGLVLLGFGFLYVRATASPGYKKGLWGIKYFYKTSHDSYIYKAQKLTGEHKATFVDLGNAYAKDKNQVYFKGKTLEAADPQSFTYGLFDIKRFSKDKSQVYYDGVLFSQDAANFEQINEGYYRDSQSVYKLVKKPKAKYMGEMIVERIETAAPGSFEVIEGMYGLSRDATHVFYNTKLVKGAQRDSFKYLAGCWTDTHAVFFHDRKLRGANVATFRELQYPYFTDGERVYYESEVLAGAHLPSLQFIPKASDYSKDNNQVFFKSKALPNVDMETIEKVNYRHWKDKNQVYFEDKILPDAHPKSFKLLKNSRGGISNFGRDSGSVYFKAKKLKGVNPQTFQVIGKDLYGNDIWGDGKHSFDAHGAQK